MPGEFWREAVTIAIYILNRTPTRSIDSKMPYQVWYGTGPSVQYFHTFGCIAHVKEVQPNIKKVNDRRKPMVFIGYELGSKAYQVYDPIGKRVHVTRDVFFDEAVKWD